MSAGLVDAQRGVVTIYLASWNVMMSSGAMQARQAQHKTLTGTTAHRAEPKVWAAPVAGERLPIRGTTRDPDWGSTRSGSR